MNIIQEKNRLGNIAIQDALQYWTNNKNGIYRNDSDKQFNREYCDEQINYFKKLKL
jgi:hypothetical protein